MRPVALDPSRVDAYLARLGGPAVSQDRAGLARLQAAHLRAVPFHNLILLANDGRPWRLQGLAEVVDEAIAGVGGNCDRTTPPFTALLQALGFDAQLAAATVGRPGDHFVCVVGAGGGRFLCDVGNGHPYLEPWDLEGPVQEQSFQGWRFRFDPQGPAGPTLQRRLPDGRWKTVYVVDPRPKAYADFEPMVTAHYQQAGFGPFLAGLRAVRIGPDRVLSLRDGQYARDTATGRSVRQIRGADAFRALLTGRFALPRPLVDQALQVLKRRRPELLAEPRWFALGRGRLRHSEPPAPPPRAEVPDVLVSLATVGRHAAVQRLLESLAEEVRASGYPGRIGVVVVENHPPGRPAAAAPAGLAVHRLPIEQLRPALERAAAAGVVPDCAGEAPVPIAAAREAQVAALHAHLSAPVPGLPHPAEHPTVVWMLDDDLTFEQLGPDGRTGRHTHLLYRAARYWAALPQHSVVLGSYTGDPPIPGHDSLAGQLHDLAANLERMVALGPDAPWAPGAPPSKCRDAYYDLAEADGPVPGVVWPFAPAQAGSPVRRVALALVEALPRLLDGQQVTRPLHWDGVDQPPRPSLRRGGNALFLDVDALFRWPTPAMQDADGVVTRRGDTLWAALAQAEDPGAVVEVTLPLLHGRSGQAQHLGHERDEARRAAAQVRGVVLARALSQGRAVHEALPAREARVVAQRQRARAALSAVRGQLLVVAGWGSRLATEVDRALGALAALDQRLGTAAPLPGDPARLTDFLARLPEAVAAWRRLW